MIISKTFNNKPSKYLIKDDEGQLVCVCKPLLTKYKNLIDVKFYLASINEDGLIVQKISNMVPMLYEYMLATIILWLVYDDKGNKVPFNKQNLYNLLSLIVYFIGQKIVLKLNLFNKVVDLSSKN